MTIEQVSTDYKNPTYAVDKETGVKLKVFMYEGRLCRQTSRMRRSFWPTSPSYLEQLEHVTAPKKQTMTPQKAAQKALNLLHPNAWHSGTLREHLQAVANGESIDSICDMDMLERAKFRNITSIFTQHELESIRKAFDRDPSVLTESSYSTPEHPYKVYSCSRNAWNPKGRDYSVNVQVYEDGNVLAWFNSEYYRCGNGDYYLLLNPTTAIFYEKD